MVEAGIPTSFEKALKFNNFPLVKAEMCRNLEKA